MRARAIGFLSTLIFGAGVFATEVPLRHIPAEHEVIREDGVLTLADSGQPVSLIPEGGFEAGKFYEFTVLYRNNHSRETDIRFLTGREDEQTERIRLFFNPDGSRRPETMELLMWPAGGGRTRRTIYRWNYLPPGGRSQMDATFSAAHEGLRRMDIEADRLHRTLERDMPVRVGLAFFEDEVLVYANGILLTSYPFTEDFQFRLAGRNPAVKDSVRVSDWGREFLKLDISEQLNCAGIGGKTLQDLPSGGELVVGGIPFRLSRRGEFDNIDLSRSLIPVLGGNYQQTMPRVRWPGAESQTPLRVLFNLPYDDYEALYVLAATDDRENMIPRFTAQIYRPSAGHPKKFASGEVPSFLAGATVENAYPVKTAEGGSGHLYLIRVALDPGQIQEFSSDNIIGLELTKDVETYKNYPDPNWISSHGMGLPSAVRIFGITLGYSPLKTTFDPDAIANIWTEGEEVSYTVTLENSAASRRRASLAFEAISYDGTETHRETRNVRVRPGRTEELNFSFMPARFGHHDISLVKEDESGVQTFKRTMSYLRDRDYEPRGFDTAGTMYGTFDDGHYKPSPFDRRTVAGKAGFESFKSRMPEDPEVLEVMRKYGQRNYRHGGNIRFNRQIHGIEDMDEAVAKLVEFYENAKVEPDAFNDPRYITLFSEPRPYPFTRVPPEFYGEPAWDANKHLSPQDRQRLERAKFELMAGARAFRKVNPDPDIKLLAPHGNAMYLYPFLKDPETRYLFDGAGWDSGYFHRMPERQIAGTALHRYWMHHRVWERYRDDKPFQVYVEGPCISYPRPGGQDEEAYAAHTVRAALILSGYDCHLQHSTSYVFAPGNYWGEQQYARGLISRINGMNPFLAYSAFATHIRHTRDARFESYTYPGSYSVYCSNFRQVQSGELTRIIWNMRGTREVIVDAAPDSIRVYDAMDNIVAPENRGGRSVLTVGKLPLYVYGTNEGTSISVGASDHSDSALGEFHVKLGNAAELFTTQSDDADPQYLYNVPAEQVRRFPATMQLETVDIDPQYGSRALSVYLPEQEIDRKLMPYYTCLKPEAPLTIEGKGAYLSMWVHANSDWGRVVYVLRDANDTLWYSVGQTGSFNGDDIPGASEFHFDGWRLLRFEMPARTAWDNVRNHGHTWWGSDGHDNVIKHPLALEKIFVERRRRIMYGNDLVDIEQPKPVLLGDLYVEYEKAGDMTEEAVRILNVRMPELQADELPDVVADLRAEGTLPAGRILSVEHPDTHYDGARGIFNFEAPEGAVSFDIYVSRYPDGRGALRLAANLDASGALVRGFLPGEAFYAFLVYRLETGETSLPSDAFKFILEDLFAEQ